MCRLWDAWGTRLRGFAYDVWMNLTVNGVTYVLVTASAFAGSYFGSSGGATTVSPSSMPSGYETSSFVSSSFQDVEDELKNSNVSLKFDPLGLRRIRFCGDANFSAERKSGAAHLNEVLDRLNGCLKKRSDTDGNGKMTITVSAGGERYARVERSRCGAAGADSDTETLHFCGCAPETVKYVQEHPEIP